MSSKLNHEQILQNVHEVDTGLRVVSVGGTLVTEEHDSSEFTYVTAGNGIGEIETAVYKLNGVTVATLTFSYNASNKLTGIVKT